MIDVGSNRVRLFAAALAGNNPVDVLTRALAPYAELQLLENPTVRNVVNLLPGLPPQLMDVVNTVAGGGSQTATTTTTYLHTDLLSSPIRQSGSTGTNLAIEQYDPYGVKLNGMAEKLGYTAHVFDDNTGLTYMQARFYDAAVGRFLSTDPIEWRSQVLLRITCMGLRCRS